MQNNLCETLNLIHTLLRNKVLLKKELFEKKETLFSYSKFIGQF